MGIGLLSLSVVAKVLGRSKKELFGKQLSKHSIGAYTELCQGVGVSFEAAPLFNSGNMPCSEPEGEPAEVRVILMVLRRHVLMSRLVRKHLHIKRYPLIKDQLFTAGKCKTYPRARTLGKIRLKWTPRREDARIQN
jgi:hypothetical protein